MSSCHGGRRSRGGNKGVDETDFAHSCAAYTPSFDAAQWSEQWSDLKRGESRTLQKKVLHEDDEDGWKWCWTLIPILKINSRVRVPNAADHWAFRGSLGTQAKTLKYTPTWQCHNLSLAAVGTSTPSLSLTYATYQMILNHHWKQ